MIAMKPWISLITVVGLALIGCGSSETQPTTTNTPTPIVTNPPAQPEGPKTPPEDKPQASPTEGGQSFQAAMRVVCDSPTASGAKTIGDPAEKAVTLSRYISGNLTNQRVIETFSALANAPVASRTKIMRDLAREAGLDDCEFLDGLAQ